MTSAVYGIQHLDWKRELQLPVSRAAPSLPLVLESYLCYHVRLLGAETLLKTLCMCNQHHNFVAVEHASHPAHDRHLRAEWKGERRCRDWYAVLEDKPNRKSKNGRYWWLFLLSYLSQRHGKEGFPYHVVKIFGVLYIAATHLKTLQVWLEGVVSPWYYSTTDTWGRLKSARLYVAPQATVTA